MDDVRPGTLVDEADGIWSVTAGDRVAPASAWSNDDFAALKDHVTFSWHTLEWYEEDERVYAHPAGRCLVASGPRVTAGDGVLVPG